MPSHFLRLAYIAEFLLALLTILTFWSEIGGQDHLDLMPWYVKFVLSAGLALTVVLATAAAVSQENAWNKRTILYFVLGIVLLTGMGLVTYYYHLHENDEEEDQGDPPTPVAGVSTTAQKPDGFSRWREASATAQAVVRAERA